MPHINPNLVIISLFTLAGLATTLWGWASVAKVRRAHHWPSVDGQVVECRPESEQNDLLPHIELGYRVDGRDYVTTLQYPRGLTPDEVFRDRCLEKYPKGAAVRVHYDPVDPARATLLDVVTDDWMIVWVGALMTVFGAILIAYHRTVIQ